MGPDDTDYLAFGTCIFKMRFVRFAMYWQIVNNAWTVKLILERGGLKCVQLLTTSTCKHRPQKLGHLFLLRCHPVWIEISKFLSRRISERFIFTQIWHIHNPEIYSVVKFDNARF